MSSATGSSFDAFFCATSMMLLPSSIAASRALIDFGRPTNSGITMCGNTTTSRSGSSGSDCSFGVWASGIRISRGCSRPMLRRKRRIQAMRDRGIAPRIRPNGRPPLGGARGEVGRGATAQTNGRADRTNGGLWGTKGEFSGRNAPSATDARSPSPNIRQECKENEMGTEAGPFPLPPSPPKSVRPRDLRRVGVDDQRLAVAFDRVLVDDDLLHVLQAGQVEHDVEQRLLEDR